MNWANPPLGQRQRNEVWRDGVLAVAIAITALIPILWAIGVDQAGWLLISAALGVCAIVSPPRSRLWMVMAGFVAVAALSGVIHASGARWITLTRDLLILTTFWLAVLGIQAAMANAAAFGRLKALLVALASTMLVSTIGSLVVFAFQIQWQFTTPIAPLVPPVIANTSLGTSSLIIRSLGEIGYFLDATFIRPRGLFLFSTSEAVAAAVTVPLFLVAASWIPRWRALFWAAAVAAVLTILATTTRGPAISLAVSVVVLLAIRVLRRSTVRHLSRRALTSIGAGVIVVVLLGLLTSPLWSTPAWDLISTRSLPGRSSLYERTVAVWAQQPILGWGTEKDVAPTATASPTATSSPTPVPPSSSAAVNQPPLGSHSQYLGVLFKQGIVGLLIFAAIVIRMMMAARSALSRHDLVGDALAVAFGVSLLAGITEEMWLDPATSLVIALAWGCLLGLESASRAAVADPAAS